MMLDIAKENSILATSLQFSFYSGSVRQIRQFEQNRMLYRSNLHLTSFEINKLLLYPRHLRVNLIPCIRLSTEKTPANAIIASRYKLM